MTEPRLQTNIAHVTLSLGGIKTYIQNVLNFAEHSKFRFVLIAPLDKELEQTCAQRNIAYYPINAAREIAILQDFMILFKIINIIKKEKAHIVHCHSAKGGLLGRMAGKICRIKTIYTPNAFSYLSFTGLHRTLYYLIEFFCKKLTDVLLAVSNSESNRAVFELGYPRHKVRVVLNAIEIPSFIPKKLNGPVKKIGMIGRLTMQKNPILFLEIVLDLHKIYPNLEFSILGAGYHDDRKSEIESFIAANDLSAKINFLPWGDTDASSKFLADLDVFVLTSVFEGLPYSLLEAMSLGIPCVVSKADGNNDVIQNSENGFACITSDDFIKKIEMLMFDSNVYKFISDAGFVYVNQFHSITKNIKKLEAEYVKLME